VKAPKAVLPARKSSELLRCAICGSTVDVERHHVGGRNHVAWFTMPLCREHHQLVTESIRRAGVDLRHTSDPVERVKRASQATLIFQWMLTEMNNSA
jgi:hypothetical protein